MNRWMVSVAALAVLQCGAVQSEKYSIAAGEKLTKLVQPGEMRGDWTLTINTQLENTQLEKGKAKQWSSIARLRRANTVYLHGAAGEPSYAFDLQVINANEDSKLCKVKVRCDMQPEAKDRNNALFNNMLGFGSFRWGRKVVFTLVCEGGLLDFYINGEKVNENAMRIVLDDDEPRTLTFMQDVGSAASANFERGVLRPIPPPGVGRVNWARCNGLIEYFVSPNGDDMSDGLSAITPFKTVQRAIAAARKIHDSNEKTPVQLNFASGSYAIKETLSLDEQDNMTLFNGASDTHFSALLRVKDAQNVKPSKDGLLRFPLPVDKIWPAQLWINGRRAERARWPKRQRDWKYATPRTDFYCFNDVQQVITTNANVVTVEQKFVAHSNELDKVLSGSDVEVVAYHNWDITRRIILSYDAATHTLISRGTPFKPWNKINKHSYIGFENVNFCEEGEWYADRAQKCIVYRPRKGEKVNVAQIAREGMQHIITLNGVQNVTFRNITFEGSDAVHEHDAMTGGNLAAALGYEWNAPGPRQSDPKQAAAGDSAAVLADYAEDLNFENCNFTKTGEYGLWLRDGCKNCDVVRCRAFDNGAGGIRIGGTLKTCVSRNILVENCVITDTGHIKNSGVGLWIGEAAYSKFLHNHIHHITYSGISMGWNWSYNGKGDCNEVAYNLIEDIGLGGLTDLGCIYTLGKQTGTTIHDNVLRRVDSYKFCRWALYFDQGTTGITAYNNLCYDAVDGGFTFHYGRDNVVSNNIFAAGLVNHMVNVGRAEDFKMIEFTHNIIWWDMSEKYWEDEKVIRDKTLAYRDYGRDRKPGTMVFSSNIWCCVNGEMRFRNGDFSKPRADGTKPKTYMTMQEWMADGNGEGELVADPHFRNPSARDFTFKSNETIQKIGFVPWDYSTAGLSIPEECVGAK